MCLTRNYLILIISILCLISCVNKDDIRWKLSSLKYVIQKFKYSNLAKYDYYEHKKYNNTYNDSDTLVTILWLDSLNESSERFYSSFSFNVKESKIILLDSIDFWRHENLLEHLNSDYDWINEGKTLERAKIFRKKYSKTKKCEDIMYYVINLMILESDCFDLLISTVGDSKNESY